MVGCCCRCAIFCLLESSPLLSCQPSRGDAEWQAFLSRLRDVPEPQSESRGVTDIHNFYLYAELEKLQDAFLWGKKSCCPESCGPGAAGPACRWCKEGDAVVQAGNGTAQLWESSGKISFDFFVLHVELSRPLWYLLMLSVHRFSLPGEWEGMSFARSLACQ